MTAYSQRLRPLGESYPASGRQDNEKLQILLVNDEISTPDVLGGALKFAGYSTYHVHTGRDALLRCRSERPQLILLYTTLPDVNGKDLIRELRQ